MGHPDWQTKTIITNSQLDVEVINSTLDVNVTNSVLNISGQVEVTNSELDVNVTNSTLNITGDVNATIQGTASVSIDSATITVGVATLKEQASEQGYTYTAGGGVYLSAGSSQSTTAYTNSTGKTEYIEAVLLRWIPDSSSDILTSPFEITGIFKVYISGVWIASIPFNLQQSIIDLDPAIRLPDGDYVQLVVDNKGTHNGTLDYKLLLRGAI